MAAHGSSFIRLRLLFDYPPPAVVGCRMCWLLVDLNACRVVADLESIIREKFEFSRRSILSLFVEDCYLPHTESIYVVRDNDSVRVKVDCLSEVNGISSSPEAGSEKCRKRRRDTGEDGSGERGVQSKKKKKTKSSEESTAEAVSLNTVQNKIKESGGKTHTKKKKKKKLAANSSAAAPKPAPSLLKKPACVNVSIKSTKKVPVTLNVKKLNVPSSDSSRTEEKNTSVAPKAASNPKPTQKKAQPPSSCSSESDSSSDEANSVKVQAKPKPWSPTATNSKCPLAAQNSAQKTPATTVQAPQAPRHKVMESPNQDSEEDIQLVVRRPQQPSQSAANHGQWPGRGRGTGLHWTGGAGPGGWCMGAEGNKVIRGQSSFDSSCSGAKEPSYQTDCVSNVSVVLQNGAGSVPQKDFSSMPLLAAPPQVGQKIAFKLLELTDNYSPEVSEYKEGKIMSFDPTTNQIELELLNASEAPVEPGKFDLVYQNPDGSESVEYAIPRGSWVSERWESLLEPRLIL